MANGGTEGGYIDNEEDMTKHRTLRDHEARAVEEVELLT